MSNITYDLFSHVVEVDLDERYGKQVIVTYGRIQHAAFKSYVIEYLIYDDEPRYCRLSDRLGKNPTVYWYPNNYWGNDLRNVAWVTDLNSAIAEFKSFLSSLFSQQLKEWLINEN